MMAMTRLFLHALALLMLCTTARADWPAPTATEMAAMEGLQPHQRWDDPAWLKEREKITSSKFSCQERWDTLWTWAKRGNLQARAGLFAYEAGMIHVHFFRPHFKEDKKAGRHAGVFLAIHQLGYKDDSSRQADEWPTGYYMEAVKKWKHPAAPKVFACYKENPSPKCTEIAIKEGVVQEFAAFAKYLDGKISEGAKPYCEPPIDEGMMTTDKP